MRSGSLQELNFDKDTIDKMVVCIKGPVTFIYLFHIEVQKKLAQKTQQNE